MSIVAPKYHVPELNATVRTFKFDDIPQIATIFNAYTLAIGQKATATVEQLENIYRNFGTGDPLRDVFIIEVGQQPIGYYSITWKDTFENERVYVWALRLMPEYLGSALIEAVLPFIDERAKELGRENPSPHAEWVQTAVLVNKTDKTTHVVEDNGYTPIRYSYTMTRDLNQPIVQVPLPEGLEVRPATADDAPKAWEADMEAFRDHWGFREPTEADYQGWINDPIVFQPSLWKIAWDGDKIAGMIWNFIDHPYNQQFNAKRGYTESISTQRAWRKKGVAAALLSQSLQMHKDLGMTEAALSVDAQNPNGALGVYERAGFVVEYQYTIYRKPLH